MNKILVVLIVLILSVFMAGCVGESQLARQRQPVYETIYSGTLTDLGLKQVVYTFDGARSVDKEKHGKDFWLNDEYTFTICGQSSCSKYTGINAWDIKTRQEIIGYR